MKCTYDATVQYSAPGKALFIKEIRSLDTESNLLPSHGPNKRTHGLNLHHRASSSKNHHPGEHPQGKPKQELLWVTEMALRRLQHLWGLSPPVLLHQAGVEVLPLHELHMLLQLSLPQHQDLVGIQNRVQLVGDHQHRAVPASFPVLQLKGEDRNTSER